MVSRELYTTITLVIYMRESSFTKARYGKMGNALSIERQIFPGLPNPNAEHNLIRDHFTVGEFYAVKCTASTEPRVTAAVFHGNMEDFATTASCWRKLPAQSLVGFEYPGYGWRETEQATQAAVLADVPRQVAILQDQTRVVVCGRSLGTFAAVHLAIALGPIKCAGLLLVSPMLTAIATKVPIPLHRALAFVDYLDNESAVKLLSSDVPVLIVHGEADLVVPVSNARALCKLLPLANYIELPEVHHNDVMRNDTAWEAILEWFKLLVP